MISPLDNFIAPSQLTGTMTLIITLIILYLSLSVMFTVKGEFTPLLAV